MVNEQNLTPQTETVCELKEEYQIPSFEEFMQSYEHDANLNYDDLSGGDVGEAKGYGPCYKDCNWANPNCECYISASEGRYVPLHLICPAPRNSWPYCTDKTAGP